jgi:hypothetical protein
MHASTGKHTHTLTHSLTHKHTPLHAHTGPFTPVYRANLLTEWTGYLQKAAVPHSEGSSLIKTLQDPIKVQGSEEVKV